MRAALAVLAVVVFAGPANADDLKKNMAKRHFETGTAYYKTANYEEALDEFRKAYKLFPAPKMLYNIGRCFEALGKLEEAVAHYERFLTEDPEAKERAVLEERIRNIRKRIEAARPEPVSKPDPSSKPEAGPESRPGIEDPPGQGLWPVAGWTLVATGAAALVVAGVLGGMALSKTGEYEEAHQDHKPYREARDLLDSAESLERGSFFALSVGVVCAATGAVVLLLKGTGASSEARTSLPVNLRATAAGFAVDF